MYSKLYYDKQNKKFYVKELNTEKNGDILVVTDEQYVDVTDEIVELFQERARDGKQVLCFDTTTPQLPDTVYSEGKKFIYCGYPSVGGQTKADTEFEEAVYEILAEAVKREGLDSDFYRESCDRLLKLAKSSFPSDGENK